MSGTVAVVGKYEITPVARPEGDVQIAVDTHGVAKVALTDSATGSAVNMTDPVKTIGSHSATTTISATGVGVAVPCTLVRFLIDDAGTNGTAQFNDNASAASGIQYGPHKLTATPPWEYGVHFTAGIYVTLGGSAKITLVYKADP